jgi:3'(2'), 5'-bisphosphate nucleotidase
MKNPDIAALCDLARRAGQEILRIAETPFTVDTKSDHSPVTIADKASDALIRQGLAALFPDIPILSEESAQTAHDIRTNLDPLLARRSARTAPRSSSRKTASSPSTSP